MSLSRYEGILAAARRAGRTVPAFNCINMETVKACARAASDMRSGVILQCYHEHLPLCGAKYISALANAASEGADCGLCLGLDHGEGFEQAKECVDAGFSGVMVDLSRADYDENVALTRRVVAMAREKNVSVEAELGCIMTGAASDDEIASGYTDPDTAVRFVRDTGVTCLAVSIGTVHGAYARKPRIQFDLLGELVERVPCPVVVHGVSGTPEDDILRMVRLGVAKMNIGTDLFDAFNRGAMGVYAEKGAAAHPVEVMHAAEDAVYEAAVAKLRLLTAYRKD